MNKTLAAIAFCLAVQSSEACTIFVVARSGQVLAGANEDYTKKEPFDKHWLRFVPAKGKGTLGFVGFGYRAYPLVDQAAINEAGLFFDYNALAQLDTPRAGMPKGSFNSIYEMLTSCRTVAQAIAVLERIDMDFFSSGQMVIGDATGASAILERHVTNWRAKGRDYQIGTNFRTSTTPADQITCDRYLKCDAWLKTGTSVTKERVRSLLEKTMPPRSSEGNSWYSMVCDLKRAKVDLFRKGDFASVVTFDVKNELKAGARRVDMDEFVSARKKPYRHSR